MYLLSRVPEVEDAVRISSRFAVLTCCWSAVHLRYEAMCICICIPVFWRELASIWSLVQRVQTVALVFFMLKNASMHYFNNYCTYSKGSNGCCEGTLGNNLLVVVWSHHVPVAWTHMAFVCGELLGKELAIQSYTWCKKWKTLFSGSFILFPRKNSRCA